MLRSSIIRLLACTVLLTFAAPAATERLFEIDGIVEPNVEASVSLFDADEPFAQAALADSSGHFRFARVKAGAYTVAVVAPGRGDARITIEAGPGTADAQGRVPVKIEIPEAAKADFERRHSVAAPELAVTARARREYEQAQKALARRDSASARKHLESAVAISPGFVQAWNNLGTVAYQTRQFERAAECFEKALAVNPAAWEPLVNFGGVLINLGRLEDARNYNQHAVLVRPNDALANSQLGIAFFEMGQYGPAEKFLRRACELDPAHFSHPQLALASIHIRQNRRAEAIADLQGFLRIHPDAGNAAELRKDIEALQQ